MAGRPKKNTMEKAVKITVTIDAETLATISAAGYSNSKLLKFSARVMKKLMERGEIIEELLKGPGEDTEEIEEVAVQALIKNVKAEEARIKSEEAKAQAAKEEIINNVLELICRLRYDILDGKFKAKWALKDALQEAPPGLFSLKEINDFLTLDERSHVRKRARTETEIIDHYNEIFKSENIRTELIFLVEKENTIEA